MDDTRARFLTAIAGQLGADRIVELHVFSPIRQGVLETGVAVVAATPAEAPAGGGEPLVAEAALAEEPVAEKGDSRLVVFTARYRLTRKGPDRGKWLFEVAATADAPLATVDQVARGVRQRAKDLTETERLSGDELRALLGEPTWRTPT